VPKKNPSHPGDYVWEEILEPRGLTVGAAADVLGVCRESVSRLLNRSSDLSAEMSIRIEGAFGVPAERLLRMQAAWDVWEARKSALYVPRYRAKNVVMERCGKRGRPTMRVTRES
jgi:addiction module HigA family antidote